MSHIKWSLNEQLIYASASETSSYGCLPCHTYGPRTQCTLLIRSIHSSLGTGNPGVNRFWLPRKPQDVLGQTRSALPPSDSKTCILVIVDRFSKACHLVPLKVLPSAMGTAELMFNHVFWDCGLPEDIPESTWPWTHTFPVHTRFCQAPLSLTAITIIRLLKCKHLQSLLY